MIHPAPTSKIDPRLARGTLDATGDGHLTMAVPNSSYRIRMAGPTPKAEVGKRLVGRVSGHARRIDVVESGGRYIEPVYGSPRRIQGRVVAIEQNAIVVHAGIPIHCMPTDARQNPAQFEIGDFVALDLMDGVSFVEA
ncbi:MAG: hypothetical protein KDA28_14220 [Phycisphaerales bacterium]|nr:hypothetical protein [Phycisphaerales bacterium]